MKQRMMKKLTALLLIYVFLGNIFGLFAQVKDEIKPPKMPDITKGRGSGSKSSQTDKMSVELRMLYGQVKSGNSKSKSADTAIEQAFSDEQLLEVFGIEKNGNANPSVSVSVNIDANTNLAALKEKGMKIYMFEGSTVYGEIAVLDLGNLADLKAVREISAMKAARNPELPKVENFQFNSKNTTSTNMSRNPNQPLANEFNKAGLTGKGVIIGVIDSGIDWRHPDFMRPDGTSRILAIWDPFDKSFERSGGKIGTAPPKFLDVADSLPGTIYTNEQINAALKGNGEVNSADLDGHGTAVAGTAAGNGGKLGAKFAGVAPDADLIIVRVFNCEQFSNKYVYGAKWITETAKKLKRPVVVNMSLGRHWTTHDGTESDEKYFNSMTGKGIPGVIFTVSAGNEGRYSFHGTSKFGPKRKGQVDVQSRPIGVNLPKERVTRNSTILGVFDSRDEWGAVIEPVGTPAMVDKKNQPLVFYLFKVGGEIKYTLADGLEKPDWFDGYIKQVLRDSRLGEKTDILAFKLLPGAYRLWGLGATEKVVNGNFSFYAPFYEFVDFGLGTTKTGLVGSPGNAANVITVGAFDFRGDWLNIEGGSTIFNMMLGEISVYSSPGGMRSDKIYKPDIAAPASYTISPLSQDSKPESNSCNGDNMGDGLGKRFVTPDGLHIAWQGTSASSPFTAGVIALMLQKNPRLDAEQVRQILIKTATKGGAIGAVPNPSWGYGMLNPALAIKNTPVGK